MKQSKNCGIKLQWGFSLT